MKNYRSSHVLIAALIIGIFATGLWVLPIFGLPYVPLTEVAQQSPYEPVIEPDKLLQMVVFAGDNEPTSTANLSAHYPQMIEGLIAASVNATDKTSLVLADLDSADDTNILLIHNGVVTPVVGLPDLSGTLTTTVTEYDMTDGVHLASFLRWALQTHTDEETNTVLSYYGHGTFLAPVTDASSLFVEATPHWTDSHPYPAVVTPHALRQMLDIGTNGGSMSLDVLDLAHGFSLSLEEVYEVLNDGGLPYAETIVGSPNHAYFLPQMAGDALAAINISPDAASIATEVMEAYDAALAQADLVDGDPDVDHPRTLTVIDTVILQETIPFAGIKPLFDEMAAYLLAEFDNDAAGTIAKLEAAVANTPRYDTTYCAPQDWELSSSDGLVDVGAFLPQLVQQFGTQTGVGLRALQAHSILSSAVVARTVTNGTPWFAAPQTPQWTFEQAHVLGISLYADLHGIVDGDTRTLSRPLSFYSNPSSSSPIPYQFIVNPSGATWSDVLHRYWGERVSAEGLTLLAESCLSPLQSEVIQGELTVESIILPVEGTLHVGQPASLAAVIRSESAVVNPLVQFNVYQDATLVFSDTVGAGYLVNGTYAIESAQPFTPTAATAYRFEVTVDPDQRIQESDETNNTMSRSDVAASRTPFDLNVTMQNASQWVHGDTIGLQVTGNQPVTVLLVQLYQFESGSNPNTQVPVLVSQVDIFAPSMPLHMLTLPETLAPGPVVLNVWGVSAGGQLNQSAEIVHFNYAPNGDSLAVGEKVYYRFNAANNDDVTIEINVPTGNAAMRIWEPNNNWSAFQVVGGGAIPFNPAQAGDYLVEVEALAVGTTYSISATHNADPTRIVDGEVEQVQLPRPTLQEPILEVPTEPPIWRVYVPTLLNNSTGIYLSHRVYIPVVTKP